MRRVHINRTVLGPNPYTVHLSKAFSLCNHGATVAAHELTFCGASVTSQVGGENKHSKDRNLKMVYWGS